VKAHQRNLPAKSDTQKWVVSNRFGEPWIRGNTIVDWLKKWKELEFFSPSHEVIPLVQNSNQLINDLKLLSGLIIEADG